MASAAPHQHPELVTESMIGDLLAITNVPGIASAIIRNVQPAGNICAGVRDVRSPLPVDEETVFDAASLSKPVFAHAVLQLADQGVLSLATPVANHLPGYMLADARVSLITARHVLSHSAGLPNWRNDTFPRRCRRRRWTMRDSCCTC
jgi:CubicO group peptidase (beta-lactamase class C family)